MSNHTGYEHFFNFIREHYLVIGMIININDAIESRDDLIVFRDIIQERIDHIQKCFPEIKG